MFPSRDFEAQLRHLASKQQKIVTTVNSMRPQLNEQAQQKHLNFLKEILVKQYRESRNYTNLIIAAGYAAFFSMWTASRNFCPHVSIVASGLLMLSSVSFFIASEVFNMVHGTISLRRIGQLLRGADLNSSSMSFPELVSQVNAVDQANESRAYRVWSALLAPTMLCALWAVLILVSCFVRDLLSSVELHDVLLALEFQV